MARQEPCEGHLRLSFLLHAAIGQLLVGDTRRDVGIGIEVGRQHELRDLIGLRLRPHAGYRHLIHAGTVFGIGLTVGLRECILCQCDRAHTGTCG